MSVIQFRCTRCQHKVEASTDAVGSKLYCTVCYFQLTVPQHSTVDDTPKDVYGVDAAPVDAQEMQNRRTHSLCCPICQTIVAVERDQIGGEVKCPECMTRLAVPIWTDEPETVGKKEADEPGHQSAVYGLLSPHKIYDKSVLLIRFYCKLCGTMMYAPENNAGQECDCPDCGTSNTVPAPTPDNQYRQQPVTFENSTTYGVEGAEGVENEKTKYEPGEKLVPVVCSLCGTRMYAGESEIGMTKICPDCGCQNVIKDNPNQQRFTIEVLKGSSYSVENAPEKPAAFRVVKDYRRVEGSLDKALLPERYGDEDTDGEQMRPLRQRKLSKSPFREHFFTSFFDGWLILRLIGTALLLMGGCIVYGLQPDTGTGMGNEGQMYLSVMFGVVSAFFGLILLANTVQSLFYWSAAGVEQPASENYVDFHPVNAGGYAFWLFLLIILAATPGYLLGSWGFAYTEFDQVEGFEAELYTAIFNIISAGLFFPILYLSAVETDSFLEVLARGTLISLKTAASHWIMFYLMSIVLGAVYALTDALVMVSVDSMVKVIIINSVMLPIAAAIYFRLLGRLAFILSVKS